MSTQERQQSPVSGSYPAVAQATLRLRSEPECERVIGLAHRRGIASTMAYRGPEEDDSPIFVLVIDEVGILESFLPELQESVPGARISVIREEVAHVSPPDFLRGGAIRNKPFRTEAGHLGWVFAGGALGAGARILTETGARYISPVHETFPWGTILVNASGSFAIAILGTLIAERFIGERERLFWVLGFLGSFTTFSSFVLQTTESWGDSAMLGTLYGGGSIFLGLGAALAGIWLTRRTLRWE
ncbi:MAG TPA: CrcB family protein [Rubrobacteraceae bacterium]|nr:CrcB family protein [Rubrobacteraceae bacterium]